MRLRNTAEERANSLLLDSLVNSDVIKSAGVAGSWQRLLDPRCIGFGCFRFNYRFDYDMSTQ